MLNKYIIPVVIIFIVFYGYIKKVNLYYFKEKDNDKSDY